MKKILAVASILALGVAAAACSSGKKAASKTVASGTYSLTNIAAGTPDTCTAGAQYVAAQGNLTTGTPSIDVVADPTQIGSSWGVLQGTANCLLTQLTCDSGVLNFQPIDFTNTATTGLSSPYNCTDSGTLEITGTITGHNQFSFQMTRTINHTVGTDATCVAAEDSEFGLTMAPNATFPCTSVMGANAKM